MSEQSEIEKPEEPPFTGDAIGRKPYCDNLENSINIIRKGVIGIHAPWGEGKTWLGVEFAKYLKSQNHKTIFIDAYKNDYIEDPFTLIVSEFYGVMDKADKVPFKESAAKVMHAFLPLMAKTGAKMILRTAVGQTGVKEIEDAAASIIDDVGGLTEKWAEDTIENHQMQKASIDAFQKSLQEWANKVDKPVIIFIDELDRCRPDFAVKFIERIKHFFELENVVFILLINKDQLLESIQTVYGMTDENAVTYLDKFFITISNLPKNLEKSEQGTIASYLRKIKKNYRTLNSNESYIGIFNEFCGYLANFARAWNLSLRDIERITYYFHLNEHRFRNLGYYEILPAYFIFLKFKKPTIFMDIVYNRVSGHQKMYDELSAIDRNTFIPKQIIDDLRLWHKLHVDNFNSQQKIDEFKATFTGKKIINSMIYSEIQDSMPDITKFWNEL